MRGNRRGVGGVGWRLTVGVQVMCETDGWRGCIVTSGLNDTCGQVVVGMQVLRWCVTGRLWCRAVTSSMTFPSPFLLCSLVAFGYASVSVIMFEVAPYLTIFKLCASRFDLFIFL